VRVKIRVKTTIRFTIGCGGRRIVGVLADGTTRHHLPLTGALASHQQHSYIYYLRNPLCHHQPCAICLKRRSPPNRCGAGQLRAAWTTLLGALDRALLATHRSKFTQFLLWFVAQQARHTAAACLFSPSLWSPACCEAAPEPVLLLTLLCSALPCETGTSLSYISSLLLQVHSR